MSAISAVVPSAGYIARLAAAAYDPATTPTLAAGSSEVYITSLPDGGLVLTWRGSAGAMDWLRDGRAVPWWAGELRCWVHRGFLSCLREMWPLVIAALAERGRPPVVLAGHSKGGAEATLAAAALLRIGYPVRGLVTFGAPRTGFGGLAAALAELPISRYVHGTDLVPQVPRLLPWRHVAPAIPIGARGSPISDHAMHRYAAALAAAPTCWE